MKEQVDNPVRRRFIQATPFLLGALWMSCAGSSSEPEPASTPSGRPEPTPKLPEKPTSTRPDRKEASVADIKIVREVSGRCKPDELWGGWTVRLDNPNFFLKKGTFQFEARTPSGLLIKTHEITTIILTPGVNDYIPAFIIQPPPVKISAQKPSLFSVSGEGSQLGHLTLKMTGPMEWAPVDNSPKEYHWETYPPATGFTDAYASPFASRYQYPRGARPRSFSILFENKGERAVKELNLFGFLLDDNGELIDILQSGKYEVGYGQFKELTANSLSDNGQCSRITSKPSSYELLYWVWFRTHTGMPVLKHESIKLASW